MARLEPTVERKNIAPLKRVAWGAIFGGTFIALAILVLLGTLGIAIGATTIDPVTGDTPSLEAFSIGAGIWWLASGVIALFGGGWATSKLAGPRWPTESILHGVVTWSFTTMLTLMLMTTVVGSMISGAMRLLGTTALYAAQGAQVLAAHMDDETPNAAGGATSGERERRENWDKVWREAQALMQQRARKTDMAAAGSGQAGQADQAAPMDQAAPADQTGQTGQEDAAAQAQGARMEALAQEMQVTKLQVALLQLYQDTDGSLSRADKDAVVEILVNGTDLSRREATTVVNRWADRFQADEPEGTGKPASPGAGAAVTEMRQAAVRAAEATANAIATAAWWTFFFFIATAAAAALGAMLGVRSKDRSGLGDTVGPSTAGSPQRNDLTRTPPIGSGTIS